MICPTRMGAKDICHPQGCSRASFGPDCEAPQPRVRRVFSPLRGKWPPQAVEGGSCSTVLRATALSRPRRSDWTRRGAHRGLHGSRPRPAGCGRRAATHFRLRAGRISRPLDESCSSPAIVGQQSPAGRRKQTAGVDGNRSVPRSQWRRSHLGHRRSGVQPDRQRPIRHLRYVIGAGRSTWRGRHLGLLQPSQRLTNFQQLSTGLERRRPRRQTG